MNNKTCKNCGHRNGGMSYGKCMLSGHYISTERQTPTECGRDFENWIERPKKKGIIKLIKELFYGEQ